MRSSALAYASISRQVNAPEVIVRSNPVIRPLLDRLDDLQLQAWYVGAGREHAIATWPTTATSIGVRSDHNGFKVCAPFGLTDLFAMVVRPNAKLVNQAVYQAKAERWGKCGHG